jgi:hypothetical protein
MKKDLLTYLEKRLSLLRTFTKTPEQVAEDYAKAMKEKKS